MLTHDGVNILTYCSYTVFHDWFTSYNEEDSFDEHKSKSYSARRVSVIYIKYLFCLALP